MSPIRRNSGPEEFRVSATLFTTYLKCPQQALERVLGVYPEYTKAMFRGGLAHSIFARHLVDGPIVSADFVAACRQQAGSDLGNSMLSLALKPSEFRAITAEVEDLYDRFKTVSMAGFDGAEVPIDYRSDDGFDVRGRIDAVFIDDEGVRIVDWKTGSFLDDAVPQLEFYAMMWSHTHGALPATTEAVSLKTGERRSFHPTSDTVADTERQVAEMVGVIREAVAGTSDLDRTAGPHCRWCPVAADCAEGQAALRILD